MITSASEVLILTSVIAISIDNADIISVTDSTGEIFRKVFQNKEIISDTERKYEFYLTEAEANVTITKLSLLGNGATITLGDGTEMAYSNVNIPKTNTQSLLIYWTVRVVG